MYYQFAVVVNGINLPEVVFIRGVIPDEGIEIMKENFGREVKNNFDLTKSPGNLCISFGINMDLYGADLTEDLIYLEDRGVKINPKKIVTDKRVGISKKLKGYDLPLRFKIISTEKFI
jgi:DNA-3-methyladenine glycosylase